MQGKLTEGQPVGWKVDRRSLRLMKSWRRFTVNPAVAWKVNWCWQKVLRPMFVYRRSRGCTNRWRKLMKGTADARKVDGSWWKVLQTHGNFTEGFVAIRKVHGRTSGCTESWWKLSVVVQTQRKLTEYPRPHGKLTKVDRNTHNRTESWLKVTEGPTVARNVNRRFRECSKVEGRFLGHT